jgi:predicted nucleotidyltransferase
LSKLADALFTKTQKNVLQLLYGRPDRSFYTKEILRLTGMGVHTIKRELDRMVEAGILTLNSVGNQKHYQANPACPLYEELISIVKKTVGVADVLRDALEPLKKNILVAFVYGSMAKGQEKAQSDIDLMLIGNELSYTELMGLLIPAQEIIKRPINPTVYSRKEFQKKVIQGNNFLERVLEQDKLLIIGNMDDIGTTG